MKVVTFNIRYDNPEDGKNAFMYRRPIIQKAIESRNPDIIGLQEVLPHMADWLKKTFCDYYFIGHGREADFSGEQVLIAYKKTEYNLHYVETFWLSPSPFVPGSRYKGQSDCPRTCIHAVLEDKAHNLFRICNTHLDHAGKNARRRALEQILHTVLGNRMSEKIPFILMGDFNAEPEQSELEPLYFPEFAHIALCDITAGSGGTFHDYGTIKAEKIDYIFTCSAFSAKSCTLWKDCENGVYISDHYPLEAEVVFSA